MAEQNNAVQTAEEQKKVYSRQQERRELDNYRQTKIERIDRLRYRAYGANGATLDFGVGEGLLTPSSCCSPRSPAAPPWTWTPAPPAAPPPRYSRCSPRR